jgi:hypothetical protein
MHHLFADPEVGGGFKNVFPLSKSISTILSRFGWQPLEVHLGKGPARAVKGRSPARVEKAT